jgi:hypothetical protein
MRSRSRHLLGAPLLAMLAMLIVVTAAVPGSASPVTTSTLPASLAAVSTACPGGGPAGSVAIADGPSDPVPPFGIGSLHLVQGDVHDVVGVGRSFDQLSRFDSVFFSLYDPDNYGTTPSDASTWLDIRVTTADATYHLLQVLDYGYSGWRARKYTASDSYTVVKEDDGGWVPRGTQTVAAFLAQYGDGAGAVQVVRAPCYAGYLAGNPAGWQPPAGLGDTTYLDWVRINFAGEDEPYYNFEEHVVHASMSTPRLEITAGESITLGTGLTRDSAPYPGQKVELWKRQQGSQPVQVGTATTNARGRAAIKVHPTRETRYEWRYPPARVTSPTLRLAVATKVTLSIDDNTLRAGDKLVARGAISPIGRVVVTLWRQTDSGDVFVTREGLAGGGKFVIQKALKDKGTYRLFATVPATSDNAAGRSVTRKVTVS